MLLFMPLNGINYKIFVLDTTKISEAVQGEFIQVHYYKHTKYFISCFFFTNNALDVLMPKCFCFNVIRQKGVNTFVT